MQGLLHTILSGANIGILVLAAGAFFLRFFMGNRENEFARGTDRVAFVAAIVGVVLAIFSGLSGMFGTWPQAAMREMLLVQNKILVTIALLGTWSTFVFLRWWFGPALWRSTPLKLWSALLVTVGFINTVLVGSMGGSAALRDTILDPVFWTLNLNRFTSLSWGPVLSIAVMVAAVVLAVVTGRRQAKP